MPSQRQQVGGWTVIVAGVAYVLIGIGTPILARMTAPSAVTAWRLAAWVLSIAVFCVQLVVERGRHPGRVTVGVRVAGAVALGAFGLAALGPMRSHWGDPHVLTLALLSLVAWPILAGVPAFVVALMLGYVLDRTGSHRHPPRSHAA